MKKCNSRYSIEFNTSFHRHIYTLNLVLTYISCIILSINAYSRSKNVRVGKTATPNWVIENEFVQNSNIVKSGDHQYLLVDLQESIPHESYYAHFAYQLLNTTGIQNLSDIQVSFDPSFQTLKFHRLLVKRGDETIDRLQSSNIKILQRETELERSLYDESITAIIHLHDIREGDIIEYAYSLTGYNPILSGKYTTTLYQEYTVASNRIYNRIITEPNADIYFKYFNQALEPNVIKNKDKTEYIWDLSTTSAFIYDNNTPNWYNPQKKIGATNYKNWGEVAQWAEPLYEYDKNSVESILDQFSDDKGLDYKILKIIRFVQNKIRYLGFEGGNGGYEPNPPIMVFNQRYGDCKDKSLLLVSLLEAIGLEAFPVLVNSSNSKELIDQIPSHMAFDHCVVNFRLNNNDYYVDPTISNQGGSLDQLNFPNYNYGLIIGNQSNDLKILPEPNLGNLIIRENIVVDSIGGSANFDIVSTYTLEKADILRNQISGYTLEELQSQYLNFYSNLYPSIILRKDIEIIDSLRESENILIVKEFYTVKKFWSSQEDESGVYCQIFPLVIDSELNFPSSANRTMPYYIGNPKKIEQSTTVTLPEKWKVEIDNFELKTKHLHYSNNISAQNRTVYIKHKLNVLNDHIEADELTAFTENVEEIENQLSYYLTYDPDSFNIDSDETKLALIIFVLWSLFLATLYFFIAKRPKQLKYDQYILSSDLDINEDLSSTERTSINLVSCNKFLFLCFLSVNIYGIWWSFKAWKLLKQKDFLDVIPAARAIFGVIFAYSLFDKISDFANSKGYTKSYSSGLLAFLFIVLSISSKLPDPYSFFSILSFLSFFPVVNAYNYAILHSSQYKSRIQIKFNYWDLAILIIGGILWYFIFLGLLFPD